MSLIAVIFCGVLFEEGTVIFVSILFVIMAIFYYKSLAVIITFNTVNAVLHDSVMTIICYVGTIFHESVMHVSNIFCRAIFYSCADIHNNQRIVG